jgi:hypothetical protein
LETTEVTSVVDYDQSRTRSRPTILGEIVIVVEFSPFGSIVK